MAAAFLQNLRGYLQKEFQTTHGTLAATYARFCFGLPFAALYALLLIGSEAQSDNPLAFGASMVTVQSLIYCVLGGIAQIFATFWLVALYKLRHFAVGTALSKTETVQTFLVGWIVLGESIAPLPFLGIVVSFFAVLMLSVPGGLRSVTFDPAAWLTKSALLGLGAGAGFGVSAVCYRAASLSLSDGESFTRAALILFLVLAIQTALMGAWLAWRDREALASYIKAPRSALLIGLVSVVGSAGWFTAMTLQNAALVRALGQIELVFSFLTARFFLGQAASGREILGIVALVIGLLLIILPV